LAIGGRWGGGGVDAFRAKGDARAVCESGSVTVE
jgi:hypothetical protein